jgi:hypothetical protein
VTLKVCGEEIFVFWIGINLIKCQLMLKVTSVKYFPLFKKKHNVYFAREFSPNFDLKNVILTYAKDFS